MSVCVCVCVCVYVCGYLDVCIGGPDSPSHPSPSHRPQGPQQLQPPGQPGSQTQTQTQGSLQKNQVWTGVYSITLVEGLDLPPQGPADLYVRFRLADQKYKSKVGPRPAPAGL